MLELKNICASYGKKDILTDVSISFEKGKITAITGPNGCGKTTLLNTVIGVLRKKSGNIFIDGKDFSTFKKKELAKKIAYLPQDKNVPDMTVKNLVLHGRFPHTDFTGIYGERDRDAAYSAMEKLDIIKYANLPISSLSGGMRQNVFIAMALCQETDYILLDEPTTYLDVSNQIKLMTLLKNLAFEGKGIISVLHDLPFALSFSDKIAVMSDGAVKAFDTPLNIYASGIIEKVFGAEIKKTEDSKSYYFGFNK